MNKHIKFQMDDEHMKQTDGNELIQNKKNRDLPKEKWEEKNRRHLGQMETKQTKNNKKNIICCKFVTTTKTKTVICLNEEKTNNNKIKIHRCCVSFLVVGRVEL